jgi:hypothetical protein
MEYRILNHLSNPVGEEEELAEKKFAQLRQIFR